MSSVSARLDKVLQDAETKIQQLRNQLSRFDSGSPTDRQAIEADIDRGLSQLEVAFSKATGSFNSLTAGDQGYYTSEIESARGQCMEIRAELQRKKQADVNNPRNRQQAQLTKNAQTSAQVTDTLDEAIRVGNDTITTGNVTMTTLLDDRDRLGNVQRNLGVIDDEAANGLARAQRMLRRALCNKWLAWLILFLLLALLGVEIWAKVSKEI
jgi:hypothetical protein